MKQFRKSRYWVSESGEIFSYFPKWEKEYKVIGRNGKPYLMKSVRPEHYHPFKIQFNRDNRPFAHLSLEPNNAKSFGIHRIVAEVYCSGYFEGAHVDHIDCNIQNNHYTNLQWCTKEYNSTKRNDVTFPLYSEWRK